MISKDVLERSGDFAPRFQSAKPFKYLCIDDFLDVDHAERLLADFPVFDPSKAINEFGEVGRKAVHTALKDVSQYYSTVYDYLLSREFLSAMSAITGIPDLLPDPRMYGGGTHENANGQEMDPHVDFNYDQDHGYHRRLNLIVYLNKDWQESWGGAIELHSNPRKPETNEISAFNCIFNRAIIFETNEYSWHGFKRVVLPDTEKNRSRKSLSIYLYTRTRPQEEIAPSHGTFYVPRPLPFDVTPDSPLTKNEIIELNAAIRHRDNWIEHYQKLEIQLGKQLAEQANHIKQLLSETKPVVSGPARPQGQSSGLYPDGWASAKAEFSVMEKTRLSGIIINGWIPDHFPVPMRVEVTVDRIARSVIVEQPGEFSVPIDRVSGEVMHSVTITADRSFNSAKQNGEGDSRDLSYVLMDVECIAATGQQGQGAESRRARFLRFGRSAG
jgi:hypothetical protein